MWNQNSILDNILRVAIIQVICFFVMLQKLNLLEQSIAETTKGTDNEVTTKTSNIKRESIQINTNYLMIHLSKASIIVLNRSNKGWHDQLV